MNEAGKRTSIAVDLRVPDSFSVIKTFDKLFLGKGHFFLGCEDTGWEPNVRFYVNVRRRRLSVDGVAV